MTYLPQKIVMNIAVSIQIAPGAAVGTLTALLSYYALAPVSGSRDTAMNQTDDAPPTHILFFCFTNTHCILF